MTNISPTATSGRKDLIFLAASLAAVAGVWYAYYLHPSRVNDPLDLYLGVALSCGYAIAALVQIASTRRWTVRSTGLLFTLIGDSTLYSSITYRYFSDGVAAPEGVVDLARAFFTVGMPLLMLGIISWAVAGMGRGMDPVTDEQEDYERFELDDQEEAHAIQHEYTYPGERDWRSRSDRELG